MKRRTKKLFSLLLSLALVVGMVPVFSVPAQATDDKIAEIGNTIVYRSDLDKDGIASGNGWELQTDNTPLPGGYYKSQHFILRLNNYSGGPIIITGQDLLDITIVADGDNYIRGYGLDDGIIASPMNSGYCTMDFYVKAGSSINIDNVFNGIRIVHPTAHIHLFGQDCKTSQINIDSRGYGIYIHKGWDTKVVEDMEYRGTLTFDTILLDSYAPNQCLAVNQIQVKNDKCASILLHGKTDNSFWFDTDLMRMAVGDFGSTHLEIRPIEYHPYQPEYHTVSVTNGYATPSEASAGEMVTIHFSVKNPRAGYFFAGWSVGSGNVTLADNNATTTTFIMPNEDVSISGLYKQGYSITVRDGTADRDMAFYNQTVTITADTPPQGKEFDHWNVSGRAALADRNSPTTTFAMPKNDVVIMAVWKDKEHDPNATHTVNTSALNVREGPGSGYGRIGGLNEGDEVQVVETQDGWSKIKYGTGYGWVMSQFLEPIQKKTNPFVDVYESDEYYDAVLWAYYHDPFITNGIDATHFGPKNTVKRCESVTFLWRAMGCPKPSSYNNPFKDVKSSDYYYEPVLWAVEKGITNGTTATTFAPNDTLTTAHMITFLYRTKTEKANQGWYQEAANWAGNGYGGKPFGVNTAVNNTTNCPRGYVVMFLQKADSI